MMSKNIPNYEGLGKTTEAGKLTLLEKLALWVRNFLENAE